MRILVYAMKELIGDGVMKLPFIAGLRAAFPEAQIVWASGMSNTVYATVLQPVAGSLLDGMVMGDEALALLPARSFDLVIDTQSRLGPSLRLRRLGRRFVAPAWRYLFSDGGPKLARPEPALVDQLETLLKAAAGPGAALKPVTLTDGRAAEAARALLPDGETYVGFAPGAGGREKRWPMEHFQALARDQLGKGRRPVFIVGPAEADEVAPLRQAFPEALLPQFDRKDRFDDVDGPVLTMALAGRMAAAVANDAGSGHLLAAGGAPLLSLQQDARKSRKFRPAAQRLALISADSYGRPPVMANLPVEAASAALDRLIAAEG